MMWRCKAFVGDLSKLTTEMGSCMVKCEVNANGSDMIMELEYAIDIVNFI